MLGKVLTYLMWKKYDIDEALQKQTLIKSAKALTLPIDTPKVNIVPHSYFSDSNHDGRMIKDLPFKDRL